MHQMQIETHLPHSPSHPWRCGSAAHPRRQRLPNPWPPPSRPGATGTTCPAPQGVALRRRRPATPCQTELDVTLCFAPLLRWVLCWWRSGGLALAIDPTLKGDHRHRHQRSLPQLRHPSGLAHPARRPARLDGPHRGTAASLGAVPENMTVIKLWQQIRDQGWHPGMRYRKNITFCADGGKRLPAQRFVSRPDTAWIGRGAFSTPKAQRRCTLLVVWYSEQEEPWIILTDLAPDQVGPSWYALRFWIEASRPSRAWAGSGTRRGAPTPPASPGTGSSCRWPPCWPWPMAPGWRTPRSGGLLQATCGHR